MDTGNGEILDGRAPAERIRARITQAGIAAFLAVCLVPAWIKHGPLFGAMAVAGYGSLAVGFLSPAARRWMSRARPHNYAGIVVFALARILLLFALFFCPIALSTRLSSPACAVAAAAGVLLLGAMMAIKVLHMTLRGRRSAAQIGR